MEHWKLRYTVPNPFGYDVWETFVMSTQAPTIALPRHVWELRRGEPVDIRDFFAVAYTPQAGVDYTDRIVRTVTTAREFDAPPSLSVKVTIEAPQIVLEDVGHMLDLLAQDESNHAHELRQHGGATIEIAGAESRAHWLRELRTQIEAQVYTEIS